MIAIVGWPDLPFARSLALRYITKSIESGDEKTNHELTQALKLKLDPHFQVSIEMCLVDALENNSFQPMRVIVEQLRDSRHI